MDKLFINELKVTTTIGVYAWEKQIKQKIIVDIELINNIQNAAAKDDLTYTLDYKKICELLTSYIEETNFQLLETVAEKSAQLLLEKFSIEWLRLTIRKPNVIPNVKEVAITIERSKLSLPA